MSSALPRFTIAEAEAGFDLAGFVRGVARRFDRRMLVLSILLVLVAKAVFEISHFQQTHIPGGWQVVRPPSHWKFMLLMQTTFVLSLVVGALAADEAVARGARRLRSYLAALVIASAFADVVQWSLTRWLGWIEVVVIGIPVDISSMRPLQFFLASLLFGGFGYSVYVNQRTARLAGARMRRAELERAAARRRTVESRLQALQARVEPQFLFNTLTQVGELYERDAEIAGSTLDSLIAYLRAALPHLRESTSTVGRELELARAYLDIMRVRLGNQLEFNVEVPEAAKAARMPPMLLLPLIDHALVYGLQPGGGDGSIRVAATASGGRLQLAISDSGAGLVEAGAGTGLADIAERLQTIYGGDARFAIEPGRDRGTCATLEIPYEDSELRDR